MPWGAMEPSIITQASGGPAGQMPPPSSLPRGQIWFGLGLFGQCSLTLLSPLLRTCSPIGSGPQDPFPLRSHFTNCSLGNHSAFQEETLATWLQWDFVPRHGQLREGCGPYRVGCHQQRAQREVLTLTAAIEGFFPSPAGG